MLEESLKILCGKDISIDVIQRCFKLDQEFFPFPWTYSQWQQSLLLNSSEENPAERYFLIKRGDAFLLFKISYLEELSHLIKILVCPSERRKKIGAMLFDEMESYLKEKAIFKIYLEVQVLNHVALSFYERMGFKVLHRAKSFYSSGEDAFILMKNKYKKHEHRP